jgi:lysophospholipase L1-like esterase
MINSLTFAAAIQMNLLSYVNLLIHNTPTISFDNASVSVVEGNSGTANIVYTVRRSSSVGALSVAWNFTPGTTSADDFAGGAYPAGGILSFADGVATATITIGVNGDTSIESNENFYVGFVVPSGYAAGLSISATGTIINDDSAPPPALVLSPTNASILSNAAAGTTLFSITGVPAGITPSISPNDGRVVIAGDATNGWKAVVGMTALSAGVINYSVSATGATSSAFALTVTTPPTYQAVTTNTQPAPVLASPVSDALKPATGTSNVALAGTTTGSGTWVNFPTGTNPGAHSRSGDGSGVVGNSSGRAFSYLNTIVAGDCEITGDMLVYTTASEGQVSLIARLDPTATNGTFYEFRFGYGNQLVLCRTTGGVETALAYGANVTGFTTGAFYTGKMRLIDTTDSNGVTTTAIRCFFNGVEFITYTDTTPLAPGYYGIRGGRQIRLKNFAIGAWQLQPRTLYTPNVYDQSTAGSVVSGFIASTPGSTIALTNDDGGRFVLVDTGFPVNQRNSYQLLTTATTTKLADGSSRTIQITETKPNYTAVTNTITIGVVAPLPSRPLRLASCGGHIPNATSGSQGAVTTYQSQVPWYIGSDDKSMVRFVFDNFMAYGGEFTNNTWTLTKASYHIPGAPIPLVAVTFNGGRSLNLAVGDAAILSDPIYPSQFGLTVFPRGTQGWLRSHGTTSVSNGVFPTGVYAAGITGCHMSRGTSITNAQVDTTNNMVGQGGTTLQQAAGASCMWGTSVGTGSLSVMFLGDSITEGLQDTSAATPWGKGWAARSGSDATTNNTYGFTPGSLISLMQVSHSGDSNWANSSGSTTHLQKHFPACNVLVEAFGTNDIGTAGAGNPTAIRNNALTTWNLFRAASPGGKVLRTTLQPRTTQSVGVTSLTGDGTSLATATVSTPLPAVGSTFLAVISGATPAGYNGTFTATATSATTFTYPIASGLASPATGSINVRDYSNSIYFVSPLNGWGIGQARDTLINLFRTDLTNGLLDGIIETCTAVSVSGDTIHWIPAAVTQEGDGYFTHPYQAGGNGPIADAVRAKLLSLTNLA